MRVSEILNELSGASVYRRKNVKSIDDLSTLMTTLGFHYLDGGEYSAVFEKNDIDMVVKVFNDSCYENFINFCRQHSGNPHLPKFRGSSVKINNKARMIRIERLESVAQDDPLAAQIVSLDKIANLTKPEELIMWELSDEQKAIIEILKKLEAVRPNKCRMDLHFGNIMKRGDTMVIIDPFAHYEKSGWASGVI